MERAPTKALKLVHRLRSSVYAFPVILLIALSVPTIFKISGSSIGMYYTLTHGSNAHDPNLLYGKPRPIRSDEWLSLASIIDSQSKSDFPQFNQKIGSGRDVAIVPDAPTKNWLTFFRPQDWVFFVMPLENAFAFKWWFVLVLLVVSTYFFVLRVLNKNKKLSVLLSLAFGLSPFLLWWYQSVLLIPLAYAFLMMILGIRIINQEKIPRLNSSKLTNFLYVLALAYLGASYVLLLYAPFLISIFIVVAAFLIGYLLNKLLTEHSITRKQALQRFGLMLSPLLFIAPVIILFTIQHRDMINAIANSVYPGHRIVKSGELPFSPIYRFFDSFLMPLLPNPPTGSFYANQSEASNFILLLPFLLIPGILLQGYVYKKSKKIDWAFLFIQLLSVLLMLRITTPIANGFYNLLLLDRVPNNRLMVGVGLLGFLQLIYLIKHLHKVKIPAKKQFTVAAAAGILTLLWLLIFAKYIFHQYLVFNHNHLVVGFLAVFFSAIIAAFLFKKKVLGAALLLAFTLLSSYKIMPLERGLPFLEHSQIVNKMEQVSRPSDSWAVVDDFTFKDLPLASGRRVINGPQLYTDLNYWRQIDKKGQYKYIYNRQAHVIFVTNTAKPSVFLPKAFSKINHDMELVKGNVFKVRFTCSEFVYKNVDFVLTTHKLNMKCLNPTGNVTYPKVTFFTYKVQTPS